MLLTIGKTLAIASAIAWGLLAAGVIFFLPPKAFGTVFILGEAVCLLGLALSLWSLWLFARSRDGVASALCLIASAGAVYALFFFYIMIRGEPAA